jgi:hypothetical protein
MEIETKFFIFAKEMKKFMEFQKYIGINQNFDKKNILINYFEELYTHIENLKPSPKIDAIKTLVLNKIISNDQFLSIEEIFDEEYSLVIEILNLVLNLQDNEVEISRKINKIRLD